MVVLKFVSGSFFFFLMFCLSYDIILNVNGSHVKNK